MPKRPMRNPGFSRLAALFCAGWSRNRIRETKARPCATNGLALTPAWSTGRRQVPRPDIFLFQTLVNSENQMNTTKVMQFVLCAAMISTTGGCSLLGLQDGHSAASSTAPAAGVLAAASSGASDDKPQEHPGSTGSSASTSASAAKTTSGAPTPKGMRALKMKDRDLSSVGAKFKGWSISGPDDAAVKELFGDARVVQSLMSDVQSDFDIVVGFGKGDIKRQKELTLLGTGPGKETSVTFPVDTATELVSKTVSRDGSYVGYALYLKLKVGSVEATCSSMTTVKNDEDLAVLRDACKTLAHK